MTTDGNGQSSSDRRRQLDDILAELMRAVDAGQSIESDEWLTRYPDFATDLNACFEKQKRLERLVCPLRQAAARVLHVRCPHCHNPIELLEDAGLDEISCRSCGSSFSLVGEKTISHYSPGEKTIGHFQLLDRVGIGGFGTVWKARDTQLDRIVAVKIPRNTQLGEAQTELFLRDARAAAQLKHPNIVGVHEVGKQDGTIYIVSDFIQGASLKEWIAAKRVTPRESAELCVKIAKALHHAHEAGVIHRDLKPGNIMMDTDGEPHIVDFGLAKREAGEVTMTVEGQILGTPAYMSPEQARGEGHRVDRRADIYSLGVILFELLTGELPFRGDKQMLLVQILKDEPPMPRKMNAAVPRDLETICLKCMEKEPLKRITNAAELANELDRWLNGQPIFARRSGSIERTIKWAKRKPAIAALAGVSLSAALLLVAGLSVSNVLIKSALFDRTAALSDLKTQERKTTRALADRTEAYRDLEIEQEKTTKALERESDALSDLTAANSRLKAQTQMLEERQRELYRSMVKLAHAQALGNDVALADKNLETVPEELRGWEWRYAKRLCHPDVLTTPGRGSAEFTADGKHIITCVEDHVEIRSVPGGDVAIVLKGHTGDVNAVAISPDGKRLVSVAADNTVKIWNGTSGLCLMTIQSPARVHDIAFSPDQKHVAGACEDSVVRIWAIETGQVIHTLHGHVGPVACVTYGPDGETVFSGTTSTNVLQIPAVPTPVPAAQGFSTSTRALLKVWNADTGTERSEFEDLIDFPIGLAGEDNFGVRDIAFSPDNRTFAIADADIVRLVDVATNKEMKTFAGHVGGINSVAFNSDGQLLATASSDGTVKVWDVDTAANLRTFPWHNGVVRSVAFSRDGRWLVSSSDSEVKLWDLSPEWAVATLPIRTDAAYALTFSPDGKWLATGGGRYSQPAKPTEEFGEVRLVDLSTNDVVFSKDLNFAYRFGVLAVALNADGTRVAASGYIGTRVWETKTGEQLLDVSEKNATGEIRSVCFSPDQDFLVTSGPGKSTSIWDLSTGEFVKSFEGGGYARFSPDGSLLAVCKSRLIVWDYPGGHEISTAELAAWRLAFSPDGTRIAVSLDTRSDRRKSEFAQVLDAKTGELLLTLESETKRDYGKEDYISSVYDPSVS